MGIGGNWGEEEEMGDKFLGKDEKENSKEDRVEIKKKKRKRPKRQKRREKTKKDDRSSGRQEAREEKKKNRKKRRHVITVFSIKSYKFYTAVFRTMADSGSVDVLGLLGFIGISRFLIIH